MGRDVEEGVAGSEGEMERRRRHGRGIHARPRRQIELVEPAVEAGDVCRGPVRRDEDRIGAGRHGDRVDLGVGRDADDPHCPACPLGYVGGVAGPVEGDLRGIAAHLDAVTEGESGHVDAAHGRTHDRRDVNDSIHRCGDAVRGARQRHPGHNIGVIDGHGGERGQRAAADADGGLARTTPPVETSTIAEFCD